MDGNQIRIAYQFQSVMHGIEAGLSPFADQMLHRKAVILAQGLPISRPAARQYQNNAAPGQGFGKTLDRMHQDRSAFQRQELFGQRSSHADAAAARDDNYSCRYHAFLFLSVRYCITTRRSVSSSGVYCRPVTRQTSVPS